MNVALKKLAPEVTGWGHPTFLAGKKSFAVLDEYDGVLGVALKVGAQRRDELLQEKGFSETPYCGHQGWVRLNLTSETDWNEVNNLFLESYRFVALKRMLRALEANR